MHRVKWATPAPQWPSATAIASADDRLVAMQRPMVLRFATDSFMEDLAAILDDNPARLAGIEARTGETWREYPGATPLPPAGATLLSTEARRKLGAHFETSAMGKALAAKAAPPPPAAAIAVPPPLKLFQPSHQRYYLVAASLVCRFPGLPDHRVDPAKQERVSFVVRRLVPKDPNATTFDPDPKASIEHAFVPGEEGAAWVAVPEQGGAPPETVPGEEKLPMFGSPYLGADAVPRRLFTGLVPVSRRETYLGAPRHDQAALPAKVDDAAEKAAAANGAFPRPTDPRVVVLVNDVISPWQALQEMASMFNEATDKVAKTDEKPKERIDLALELRDRIRQASWLILLDCAAYLRRYLRTVSAAVEAGSPDGLATSAERDLYTALTQVVYGADSVGTTLAAVLRGFDTPARRDTLERGEIVLNNKTRDRFEGLPSFSFAAIRWPDVNNKTKDSRQFTETFSTPGNTPTAIRKAVEAVLAETPLDAAVPPLPGAKGALPVDRTTRFVLRCVFDRPRCGASAPSVVSEPTVPFALAPFFDPDAPARPVRIALPVDTSPAGLRKFHKSASFLVSDVLCGQLGLARKLTLGDLVLYVLPWPFHKPLPEPDVKPCSGPEPGMICSLSIPIVTICAFILLFIIVLILDIFFHWIPFLFTCFPLPLKAKEQV